MRTKNYNRFNFTDCQMYKKISATGIDIKSVKKVWQLATNCIGVKFNSGEIKTVNVIANK